MLPAIDTSCNAQSCGFGRRCTEKTLMYLQDLCPREPLDCCKSTRLPDCRHIIFTDRDVWVFQDCHPPHNSPRARTMSKAKKSSEFPRSTCRISLIRRDWAPKTASEKRTGLGPLSKPLRDRHLDTLQVLQGSPISAATTAPVKAKPIHRRCVSRLVRFYPGSR